jgi:hypothetical protein
MQAEVVCAGAHLTAHTLRHLLHLAVWLKLERQGYSHTLSRPQALQQLLLESQEP